MKAVRVVAILMFAASIVGAQGDSVKVAKDKFDVFHEVMHPAWHEAYPAKDYAALLAAGPKFEAAYAPIAKLEPSIKNQVRLAKFKSSRQEIGILVTAYGDACRKRDSAKVYEIMPNLHTAFEEAVGQLQPMEFKPIDGLIVTADIILDFHIPGENWDGMAGSTETILMKLDHITDSAFLPELADVKTALTTDFAKVRATADQMKACADKKDLACFRSQATGLKKMLAAMRDSYL